MAEKGAVLRWMKPISAEGARVVVGADCAVTVASNTRLWYSGSQNAKAASLRKPLRMPVVQHCCRLFVEYVMPKSTVFTDELPSYHGIPHMPDQGYVHRRINHSEKVYVMGDIHTNTVEGFWSLVKRGISGVLSFSWSSLFADVPE